MTLRNIIEIQKNVDLNLPIAVVISATSTYRHTAEKPMNFKVTLYEKQNGFRKTDSYLVLQEKEEQFDTKRIWFDKLQQFSSLFNTNTDMPSSKRVWIKSIGQFSLFNESVFLLSSNDEIPILLKEIKSIINDLYTKEIEKHQNMKLAYDEKITEMIKGFPLND